MEHLTISNESEIGVSTQEEYTTTTAPDSGLRHAVRPVTQGLCGFLLPCIMIVVYIAFIAFFIAMTWRLVKGVEKIANVLERRVDSGPNRPQV